MTQTVPPRFPVHVQTGWIDFSPALRQYASERIGAALAPFARQIRSVTVGISGADPQRPALRRCDVQVTTDGDPISVSPTGIDRFALIDLSADTLVEALNERSRRVAHKGPRQKIA